MIRFDLILVVIILISSCRDVSSINNIKKINDKLLPNDKSNNELKIDTIKEYFMNGNLSSYFIIENGIKNGKFLYYFENGGVYKKGVFKNNILEGKLIQFTEESDTFLVQYYSNGKILIDIMYNLGKPIRKIDFEKKNLTIYDFNGIEIKKVRTD